MLITRTPRYLANVYTRRAGWYATAVGTFDIGDAGMLLWRHEPRYYDVTNNLYYDLIYILILVTNLSFMTSLTPLLWRHSPLYYDVTHPSTMTSLTPLLWRHSPLYYDVTHPSTMTSLTPLLWRHSPLYYDVTHHSTMTSLTPLLWRHSPLYYDVTNQDVAQQSPHVVNRTSEHALEECDFRVSYIRICKYYLELLLLLFIFSYFGIFWQIIHTWKMFVNHSYECPRTPDIDTLITYIDTLVSSHAFIPSYPGYWYPRHTCMPSYPGYWHRIHTLVPRILIPSYPGYWYPRTPDIDTLVPRILIPSYPEYWYPRTPNIDTLVVHSYSRKSRFPFFWDRYYDVTLLLWRYLLRH